MSRVLTVLSHCAFSVFPGLSRHSKTTMVPLKPIAADCGSFSLSLSCLISSSFSLLFQSGSPVLLQPASPSVFFLTVIVTMCLLLLCPITNCSFQIEHLSKTMNRTEKRVRNENVQSVFRRRLSGSSFFSKLSLLFLGKLNFSFKGTVLFL